jgi:putative DNA primase/helicase
MGIAEGIETAIAATKLFSVPTWSVLSTYGIETFEPPSSIEKLIVFGDHDPNGAGQKAAYTLQTRLADRITIEVQIPDVVGDWNDVLRRRR